MNRFALVLFVTIALVLPGKKGTGNDATDRYQPVVQALETWLTKELAAKRIPALGIALVDDQTTVWSKGFGHLDSQKLHPATPDTLFRVGSVSKPFTALLLMLFVELGLIDLDAPIQDYLPELRPNNPTGKKITLRQILAHRSGLVREPPVGSYFDGSEPTLAAAVQSLQGLDLVYPPESKTSYSNAGLAVAGYVLEKTQKEPFAQIMQRRLLVPLGMKDSSFNPSPDQRKRLPTATMWTYHGREFPAPTWDLTGMSPAGSLCASPNDLAKFLKFIFAKGRGSKGPILRPESLEQMWKIAYPEPGSKSGFGIGFFVSEFEGKRRLGHGGAVYGFSTDLAALPDEKIGVIVCGARDVSNGLIRRISETSLRLMLAARAGKPLPPIEETQPIPAEQARTLAGQYQAGDKTLELYQRDGRLWFFPPRTGSKMEIRRQDDHLISDDVQGFGQKFSLKDGTLHWGGEIYRKVADETPPKPVPAKWAGLIGEYGEDHNILFILEKEGVLHALIEWVFLYPLREVSANVFQFPDYGLYHGDKLVFSRDAQGQATKVVAASVLFNRRPLPRPGETFKITPVRPLEDLRKIALAANPPVESNVFFKKPDLVEITALDPSIRLDLRYATTNNFLGSPFYTTAKAFLQRPAAEALMRAHRRLEKEGFGLLIHDAYRPWHVTRMFYDATPERFHHFVADPLKGSRHNRGCAVDLTLFDRKTGQPVAMVSGYDEFSDRSYPDYLGGTSLQRWHRDLLRRVMEEEGFSVYDAEWWHFDYRDWRQYPIQNLRFEDLAPEKRAIEK